MKKFTFLLFVLLNLTSYSQDIISSQFIVNGIISLGDKAKIHFNINQVTLCDNYSIDWVVNYISKSIDVNVNYNYFSSCSESISIFTEIPEKQILLTGTYFVKLNLNVPNNLFWNKTYLLGSITVNSPFNLSCNSLFAPYLDGICPELKYEVCACNGKSYINECESYLIDKKSNYVSGNCTSYIQGNSQTFLCKEYNSWNQKGLFEEYSCENDFYQGGELIFSYLHNSTESIYIPFSSSANDVKLFLVKIINNDVNCIASSNDNVLECDCSEGLYYLIADRINPYAFSITLCDTTSNLVDLIQDREILVYPNPTTEILSISSSSRPISKIVLYNSIGKVEMQKKVQNTEVFLDVKGLNGIYFARIEFDDFSVKTKKIIINKYR